MRQTSIEEVCCGGGNGEMEMGGIRTRKREDDGGKVPRWNPCWKGKIHVFVFVCVSGCGCVDRCGDSDVWMC